jgi:transcriptional regulator with XRE-family HTH domain
MGGEAEHFGPRLRELREAAGLTQVELAGRAGIHPQALVKLEAGNRVPSWDSVLALAEALGVSCDAFTAAPARVGPRRPGRPPKKPDAPPPASIRGRGRKGE